MHNISQSAKSYFIYFTSYANAVLDCTKELIIQLFANNSYCEMRYYIKEYNLYENALEVRISKATLLCYFDEAGKCDACYVFFDNTDHVSTYIHLCNQFFEYCSISKKWKLCSNFIMYFEKKSDKYFGFYASR